MALQVLKVPQEQEKMVLSVQQVLKVPQEQEKMVLSVQRVLKVLLVLLD
jgi:arginine repressor